MLVKTTNAIFDGKVLRPEVPLALEPNTRVRITIETLDTPKKEPTSFIDNARALNLDGPPDWSANFRGCF